MNDQDWNEYKRLILEALRDLKESHERMENKLDGLQVNQAELKTEMKIKGGVWGLIGGALPAIVALAFWLLKGA